VTGEVTGKERIGDRFAVHIDLRCTNQAGETTTPATAAVLLPSREHGPVLLPEPPAPTLEGMVTSELRKFKIN
jgi:hypothetical protein